jgi:cation transport regulator ChaB
MPYPTLDSLPDYVKKHPKHKQEIWKSVFNATYEKDGEERAFRYANAKLDETDEDRELKSL